MKTKSGKLIKNKTEVWIPRRGLDLSTLAKTKGVPIIHQQQQQRNDDKYGSDDKMKMMITTASSTNQDFITSNDNEKDMLTNNKDLDTENCEHQHQSQRQEDTENCEHQHQYQRQDNGKGFREIREKKDITAADSKQDEITRQATTTITATIAKIALSPAPSLNTTITTTTSAATTTTDPATGKEGETGHCKAPTKEDDRDQEEDDKMKYDLYAILSHSGTPQRGHYVAHVRNVRTGDWHTFNDRNIKPCHIPSNIIKSRDAYILFFQRQVFASAMNRLKIPGEPLTFKEWRAKIKENAGLGGGAQSGFFTSNHAIKKRPRK